MRGAAVVTALSCLLTMTCQEMVQAGSWGTRGAETVTYENLDINKASYLGFGRLYPFSAADTGLYYFTTTEKKSYYQVKALLNAGTSCHIEIYDELGSSLVSQADLAEQGFERFVLEPSAAYILKISGEGDTAGEIVVSEIADDYSDTMEEAVSAVFNKEYSVTTECSTDVDYLKFTTDDKDASYTLNIDPASGSAGEFELLDEAGNLFLEYSGTTNQDTKLETKLLLEHNKTYYLKIASAEMGRQVLVSIKQAVNQYKITYHLNGGTNHKDNKTSYTATQNLSLKNPTRKGYVFEGWYTTSNYSKKITAIKGSAKSNYNLYAKWKKVTVGTVSLKSFNSTSPGKAKLVFGTISGAKGYQISLSWTVNKTKKVKSQIVTKTTMAYTGLAQGEKYSVQVRAYAIDSCGNRVYGAYSKTKSVTIKKKKVKKKK